MNLADGQLEELDKAVKDGEYENRSEAVRAAVGMMAERRKVKELERKLV